MDKGILRNVVINLIGLVLPTFVSLVTVPSYIRLLGVERYGASAPATELLAQYGFTVDAVVARAKRLLGA